MESVTTIEPSILPYNVQIFFESSSFVWRLSQKTIVACYHSARDFLKVLAFLGSGASKLLHGRKIKLLKSPSLADPTNFILSTKENWETAVP